MDEIELQEREAAIIEDNLKNLVGSLHEIPIASTELMPLGWRKAAKGRTVWRIIEEIITQNLEVHGEKYGFIRAESATSEVDVFDIKVCCSEKVEKNIYINIKSAVEGGKRNKDDISKANGLKSFFDKNTGNLYVATFFIKFNADMTISIKDCVVCPIYWLPDVYVNPSNNGNLQSADYKYKNKFIKRTREQFMFTFDKEIKVATEKRKTRLQ